MNKTCSNCGQILKIEGSLGTCPNCKAVFNLGQTLSNPKEISSPPKGIEIQTGVTGTTIKISRFSAGKLFALMLVLSAFAFFMNWLIKPGHSVSIISMAIIALIFIAAMYCLAANLVNKTYIEVNGGEILIYNAPLPWPGGKKLQTENIDQIFCREIYFKNYCAYTVTALTKNGLKIPFGLLLTRPTKPFS
ncbi:MAG: hypothetical protein NTW04_03245 [Elusimicrobia bacterium]|nr:hypothetical protein [Elusimicrobiota bacterium]